LRVVQVVRVVVVVVVVVPWSHVEIIQTRSPDSVGVGYPAGVGQILHAPAYAVGKRLHPASGDRHGGVFTGFD
jgi:hypothetical protein